MSSITLSPSSGLYYPFPNPSRYENVLLLRNNEKASQDDPKAAMSGMLSRKGFLVFKVRATKPEAYNVRPRIGLLPPGETRTVRVTCKTFSDVELDDIRRGRGGKHCFQVDVRRVSSERALNQVMTLLAESTSSLGASASNPAVAASEKRVQEALKSLFDTSTEVETYTLACNFSTEQFKWEPSTTGPTADGHNGFVIETKDGKVTTIPATIVPPSASDLGEGSVGRVGSIDPLSPRALEGAAREGAQLVGSAVASAQAIATATQIRKLEEQIEDKKLEEAKLRAELLALRNQTTQLQADCDSVVKVSVINAKKLDDLDKEAIRLRQRYGAKGPIKVLSIPVSVMFILLLVTFLISLLLRPSAGRAYAGEEEL